MTWLWVFFFFFRFAFSWWLVMLSVFSCTCWPFICLLWEKMSNQIIFICYYLFFFLSYMSYLYILDINPLSDMWFVNIFSHSIGCLFILWWLPVDILCSWTERINSGKMSVLSKAIYRFNAASIEIPLWGGMGGRLKREDIYVYLWHSPCCTAETSTTLYSNYPPSKNKQIIKRNSNALFI